MNKPAEVTAKDVLELYSAFLKEGVRLWLDGGWGIDALLQRQTRLHTDLDAIVGLDDLLALAGVLSERGFVLRETWPENRWVPCSEIVPVIGRHRGGPEVATAFVFSDLLHRVIDIHVVRFDKNGSGVPAWNTKFVFSKTAFAGSGVIDRVPVRCLSPETQMQTHTGYELPEKQVVDLRLLRERFPSISPEKAV